MKRAVGLKTTVLGLAVASIVVACTPSDTPGAAPETEAASPAASASTQPHVQVGEVSVAVPDGWVTEDLDAAEDPSSAAARVLCGPGPAAATLFYSQHALVDLSNALCAQLGALDDAPWLYVTTDRSAFGQDQDAPVRQVYTHRVRVWSARAENQRLLVTAQWLDLDLAITGGDARLFDFDEVLADVASPAGRP